MPTNLPPEAVEAEKRYRAAQTAGEKVTTLEEYIGAIPKHKGTDKLRASLRKRLSKLKSESQSKKGASRQETVFRIVREGAGQVVIVGAANVGKSSMVAALTHAKPEVAEYPFTTWTPTPGMMLMENVQIQLVDTPSLDRDLVEPELLELIRRSDLILLVVDLQAFPIQQLEDSIARLGEHRIFPRQHQDRHDPDERSAAFVPLLVAVNKDDDEANDGDFEVLCELLEGQWPLVPVSAKTGRNLDNLSRAVFEALEIIRVYSKPPGKKADMSSPFVLKKGSTLVDFAAKVHRDFSQQLKSNRVWGTGVYDGQAAGRDHVLHDGDVVELHI